MTTLFIPGENGEEDVVVEEISTVVVHDLEKISSGNQGRAYVYNPPPHVHIPTDLEDK